MKISTKGRYALRLMLDIAVNDGAEPVRLKDTAKRQSISVKYLEQIISSLVRAGCVKSLRGIQGGYRQLKRRREDSGGMLLRWVAASRVPVSGLGLGGGEGGRQEDRETLG